MIGSKRFAAGASAKSNRISLRPCPERASEHMCSTHVTVCVRIKNSSNQHGRGMFPGPRCNGAAVDSAGMCVCVCLCVCEGDTEGCLGV